MSDPTNAIRRAVYAALQAAVPPSGVKVHSRAPDGLVPPVVVIGDIALGQPLTKDGDVFEATFEVLSVVEGRSPGPAEDLMGWAYGALHMQSIAASGASFTPPILTSSNSRSNEEKTLFIGLQIFTLTATSD